ncbi:MAG: N-6 DNA methylase [Anaerolineae bacterium]|nr:N-6 DNA methylase [Anaerolineae bacterium]
MMPFFALVMIESRLIRMLDELRAQIGPETFAALDPEDRLTLIRDRGQGYNRYIFEQRKTLQDICRNDKSFEIDFEGYLRGFDGETKDLLGVEASDGEKFLDIRGIIAKLKAKNVLFSYTTEWSQVDLKPFNNSEITTLEEHIKRKWADISAETAGEQYTPDDVIALIADIIASKIEETDTLLKIYDCTCGGGNLLFGVEDRINAKFKRLTQTFGQDWNDALYALARIESRFRPDSKIEHGNTLTDDKFYNDVFDVVVANPPYGVSWKGYQKDILRDKTGRFKYTPSISDGQLLFMQHLISKLAPGGIGVVVHNGSTLFSGDAGSAESNIRKWMLDTDIVEAIIQLPTDEFFNTGIYTYLWVLNKAKAPERRDRVMLINASEKFQPLKKSKGAKRKEVDAQSRAEIVATLARFGDNAYARVFDKEFFYFNKQSLRLTNVDIDGHSFAERLKEGQKQRKLKPTRLSDGEHTWAAFEITDCAGAPGGPYPSLQDYYESALKPQIAALDYKAQPVVVETAAARFYYDVERETLIQERKVKKADPVREALGCGKIEVKAGFKRATKTRPARIEIAVALAPDEEKDYEIIPYHRDPAANDRAIADFMARYITRPYVLLENVVGVEINFNKVFYEPERLRPIPDILADIATLDAELKALEEALEL